MHFFSSEIIMEEILRELDLEDKIPLFTENQVGTLITFAITSQKGDILDQSYILRWEEKPPRRAF